MRRGRVLRLLASRLSLETDSKPRVPVGWEEGLVDKTLFCFSRSLVNWDHVYGTWAAGCRLVVLEMTDSSALQMQTESRRTHE